ncbi:MAG: DNA-directed RNA polymerase subunit beta' [Chloroflexi bacterium]|nr:DNA-directed RNA polymerase subunit beta' [Chloroflexota bacterium]
MLEANDFNAIRISLASPEQIRSWSYGEVTKPETINYRTLKPERDGLFCERIFGPTKDFECYCGKYKRMRYKGVVCDKCGVEVARSKVRRERMGHIELASPVGHIWFVKGTPSRLGLLLDISPRNLEQVIYFARYIVISVDETAKKELIQRMKDGSAPETARWEQETEEKVVAIQERLQEEINGLEMARGAQLAQLEAELAKARENIATAAALVEEKLAGLTDLEAREDLVFEGRVIAAQGEKVSAEHRERLGREREEVTALLERRFQGFRSSKEMVADEELHGRRHRALAEMQSLKDQLRGVKERGEEELKEKLEDIEGIKPLMPLTDTQYREMKDKYGLFFKAGMGAEAVLEILNGVNLEKLRGQLNQEIHSVSGQRLKKATKRLRIVDALVKSGNKPQWMILTVLPVLPPDLRPMVQLDGGRFATSDLNDLYRRVINRNNRLRRLLELGAPEIIIRNEKRMLQEAVDSLVDNGRRGKAVTTSSNHRLKSLSDMLKGKQGRFRQNLLGKRVDYSGRSVIVVGPELQLHQCGLPKRMALELFKPFVMHRLVALGMAHNIKSAKRIVERVRPETWDVLEEVIKDRTVLLNRAPTLHRLGIQGFVPVLIEGSAIQVHPLVCAAFNADFDGDQMAVHVPLSREAVREAKEVVLSVNNMLSPSSGEPVVAPTLDIVLGCFYMTTLYPGAKGEGMVFSDFDEAKLAYQLGAVNLQAEIKAKNSEGELVTTSVGRILFNEVLPPELLFYNQAIDKNVLKEIVDKCYRRLGNEETARLVDEIKRIGFHYATQAGTTIAICDIRPPETKEKILAEADANVAEIERQFQRGLITEEERYNNAVAVWTEAVERMKSDIAATLDRYGSVFLMASSGAKGNIAQITQMAGMRGLMTDPSGRIIDLPIRSSFQEGLSVLEYFISTHGARKGLADTALRTADSGYLTRRLIDVSQDVIVLSEDCGTLQGVWLSDPTESGMLESLERRALGRLAASPIAHPETGEVLVGRNEEITEDKAAQIAAAGVKRVHVRSPLSCQARRGVCQRCYGRGLATGRQVNTGEAVGIIAAQSIGEPGTQLTMRTFHTGGVAGIDITSGLPRVEELFEARVPKGVAIISEIDGTVSLEKEDEWHRIRVVSSDVYRDEYMIPQGYRLLVDSGDLVEVGMLLAQAGSSEGRDEEALVPTSSILARVAGRVAVEENQIAVYYEEREEREYVVPPAAHIVVEPDQKVKAGDRLTGGSINPQDILRILGREAVQLYLVEEVQKVYRSQGVTINDKHIEIIVRQMLRKVRVDAPGDTELLPGELVDRFVYEDINAKVLAEGGEPATAQTVLLGVTKASLNTSSFLAAASFQETTRVLTEAAISGSIDRLSGLKENVIIGKLIPARSIVSQHMEETKLDIMPVA